MNFFVPTKNWRDALTMLLFTKLIFRYLQKNNHQVDIQK